MRAFLTATLLSVALLLSACLPVLKTGDTNVKYLRDVTYQISMTQGSCSGTAVGPHELLTAAHCILDMDQSYTLTADVLGESLGTCKPAKVSEKADIALLTCEYTFPIIAVVASDLPKRDQAAWAVGFPMDMGEIVTTGFIQGLKALEGATFLVATTPIAPGNSGGGLFVLVDGQFRLVGVASFVPVVPIGFGGSLVNHLAGFAQTLDIIEFLK